jgi:hypothetical protein
VGEEKFSIHATRGSGRKPKAALKSGKSWVKAATIEAGKGTSVRWTIRADKSALKAKLQQVKIMGSRNKSNKFHSLTLSIPWATDPTTKCSEIASDFVINMFSLAENLTIYPSQEKSTGKKKATKSVDEMLKSADGWNPYLERMFPLKKEG